MRELFKKHFALTDKGAKDLQKASAASFFAYVINFSPQCCCFSWWMSCC